MASQYDANGLSVTFLCGPEGTQIVEWTINVDEAAFKGESFIQVHMNLKEYLDFIIPATSEANRRRAMERKNDKRVTERRIRR